MSARILAIVPEGHEADALDGMPALVSVARAEAASVRLAFVRRLPPPRVDRHDHVVADVDREMERITEATLTALRPVTSLHEDVAIETVVRFGVPGREARLEAETYAPALVVVFASAGGLPGRLRAWRLRQAIGRRARPLLVLEIGPRPRGSRRAAGPWRHGLAGDAR